MWTMVLGAALTMSAGAKEYRLNPAASGVTIDDVLRMDPIEIDATRPDFVLIVRFRNDGDVPLVMHTGSMRCLRGEMELPVGHGNFGIGERWLDLMPGESKTAQLLCDHGPEATGDYGLVIPAVYTNPSGDGRTEGEPLVTDLVWRMHGDDFKPDRQFSGEELSCTSYRRPAPKVAPAPIVGAPPPPAVESRPLAIPGHPPPPPAAAPPPPAASLRPR
ncbi:MAG: hypothetical protein R3F59_31965 [Myxococcota bacterium]